ncbi:ribosomal RNA small subunit methyltransferase D [mine drainage metagenome]|uniref:Ribosomal RNA small subunit methyltransferase D n=1 Tax=mine drainage metagenome TaxID=410659 RepID=A0A1J5SMA5_9ZZZZ
MAEKKLNTVRINAGDWRSRLLKFPDATGLRPTPERVRQTVFNWLGQDLTGMNCLDLFAGTGVMGFEALSRGAVSATLVEKAAPAYKALLENKSLLKAEHAHIVHQDALQFLSANMQSSNPQKFHLIFLDPPYHQQWLPKVLPQLATHLHQEGWVYAEAEYGLETMPELMHDWQLIKQSKAGNVFYHLLKSKNV